MLDSSDIRNAVLELKKSILFVNRYEKAADAVAAIMGKSASLQSRPLLSDLPQDAAELALRKRELAELYGFVEQNYAQLMISGLLFPGDNESRQTFTTAYHALYLALRHPETFGACGAISLCGFGRTTTTHSQPSGPLSIMRISTAPSSIWSNRKRTFFRPFPVVPRWRETPSRSLPSITAMAPVGAVSRSYKSTRRAGSERISDPAYSPVWWNRQTHGTQNPLVVIPYGFEPRHRHQRRTIEPHC